MSCSVQCTVCIVQCVECHTISNVLQCAVYSVQCVCVECNNIGGVLQCAVYSVLNT